MRNLEKELNEWQREGLIDSGVANAILSYEKNKKIPSGNTALVIFAILGAVLVALGISLMVAENWDYMSTAVKTAIGLCPMVLGQILVLLAHFRFRDSASWREASAAFLVLTTGATLGVISQTYHMQGSMASFLMLWLLLVVPVMWLTASDAAFVLTVALTGWFTGSLYLNHDVHSAHAVWCIAAVVGYFVFFIAGKSEKRAIGIAAGVIIPVLLCLALGLGFSKAEGFAWFAYFALFQILTLVYFVPRVIEPHGWKSGMLVTGAAGMLVLLYFASYKNWLEFFWENLEWHKLQGEWDSILLMAVLLAVYGIMLYFTDKDKKAAGIFLPIYLVLTGLASVNQNGAQIMINIFILLISTGFILGGIRTKSLMLLNTGLMIFSLLVIFRFFDFKLSFFVRGISFLLLGIAFFIANRFIIAARKGDEK